MKVLICDDDIQFAEKTQKKVQEIISQSDRWVKINCVSDPNGLSDEDLKGYDMAFLDIDMGQINGIDLARKMHNVRPDMTLMFVTNFVEYSLEGYEVRAFRYLLKNEVEKKLETYVRQALSVCQAERELVRFKCDREEVDLMPQSLLYVETAGRRLALHLMNSDREILYTKMTMGEVTDLLGPRGFLRVHQSYLVNMAHIRSLKSTGVWLANDMDLPVSAHCYTEIKKTYLQWKGKKRWNIG